MFLIDLIDDINFLEQFDQNNHLKLFLTYKKH